jgi:DNA-binding CsgD family transcriptional regulator
VTPTVNEAVYLAAIDAGCSQRQAEVLATWVDSETLDDTAAKLGISQRAVLKHLREARHRLNVPHNGKLVAAVLQSVAHIRTPTAATRTPPLA